ncbi:hypothetical protein AXK56_16615 [Tsukamurella pulmonis]|nr:hypothetical protein AXK56_16615 [Tsukamurella pulmonis]
MGGLSVSDQTDADAWVTRTDEPSVWAVTIGTGPSVRGRLRDLRRLAAALVDPGVELVWHWPADIQDVLDESENEAANINASKKRLAALRRGLAVDLRGPEDAPKEGIEDVAAVLEVSKQRASDLVKEGRAARGES